MNSLLATTPCQLCGHHDWQIIDTLFSGVWDKSATELTRQAMEFPIGECQHCSHVQIVIAYSDGIFKMLYFSSTLEPDMWCDTPQGAKSPYEDMAEFFTPYLSKCAHIVDFGAGAGATLLYLEKHFADKQLQLASVDFHHHIKSSSIAHIRADLNQLEEIKPHFDHQPISLAISTHVLEHIINPVAYLRHLRDCLAPEGHIFIEVPDCSPDAYIAALAYTNLVHAQHIHYYTKDSLQIMAASAGLTIIKQQQVTTGNIPRIMLLLKKCDHGQTNQINRVNHNARLAVEQRFMGYQACQQALINQVKDQLAQQQIVGIWGIGGDFYLWLKRYPEMIAAIKQQQICLFDYELAGHTFHDQVISSSAELQHFKHPVYIAPIYAPTREKMHNLAAQWQLSNIHLI
ncbi:class I SAM-dependent methyltransferase [Shewanella sp. SNU WT4]|uniref:class I SAM-dependent methyltransferase n=1 Tax=Shewanella sp. SNU WT4 TaxID=2590015 RepID=UPI0011284E98|nr:class I SAM-dependent methyltransferase [Shewanella sp. SNU WT4]QDF66534.1 class I SAM-dependent methyltransferase [Shewanella sp. SNU WT4]